MLADMEYAPDEKRKNDYKEKPIDILDKRSMFQIYFIHLEGLSTIQTA